MFVKHLKLYAVSYVGKLQDLICVYLHEHEYRNELIQLLNH
jgi:hypothetical protein